MVRAAGMALGVAAAAALALAPARVNASPALAAKAGCAVCHAVDKKSLGPTYKDIAARYKGDPKAAAVMAQRVRKGSKGVWGKAPMLPTPAAKISDADLPP